MDSPRTLRAPNPSPFTLDGTRTHLVGERRVAVVDPGPDEPAHVEAVARAVRGAGEVVILQTHDHADHAGAAPALAALLGVPVLGAGEGAEAMESGDGVETDHGRLVAVKTPGHAARHLSFHWPARDAAFVGDLLLGEGSTTWLGAYAGCVSDFFASLDRIGSLEPAVLYPAHGPPLRDPAEALERFREHRRRRLAEIRRVLNRQPDATPEELVRSIYSVDLSGRLREAAERSVEAMVHHLRASSGPAPGEDAG